jgi:IS5 family transposase
MKQQDLGLKLNTRRTRKAQFLDEMQEVVPWQELVALIERHSPRKATGRPGFGHEVMLRLHFLQQWFNLSDVTMEEALFDTPLFCEFAGLGSCERITDRVSILRFRPLLEKHQLANQILNATNAMLTSKGLLLKTGTVVDATPIAAPSSTKNEGGERDPEIHQAKKGNQWHFGMKAHIGVDADSGLVHTVRRSSSSILKPVSWPNCTSRCNRCRRGSDRHRVMNHRAGIGRVVVLAVDLNVPTAAVLPAAAEQPA